MPCLTAWAESLGGITYPLLSDFWPHGEVSRSYGVLRPDGRSERAIFVVDKKGIVRYVDVHDIDDQPDNEELFAVLADIEPDAVVETDDPETPATDRQAETEASGDPTTDVVLYCTPWCPACRRAKAFLERRGVTYLEIDISRDRAAAAKVRGWANGNETTPTFDIGGEIVVDYDTVRLEELLG